MVGIVLLGIFVLLLAFGAPIAVCLGMSSVGAILVQGAGKPLDAIMSVLPRLCSSASSKFVLLAIPFFILSGNVMEKAGISGRLINLAEKCLGHIRGGMAMVCVVVSCFFAAISGSGPATVAALGLIMIPALKKAGYSPAFACALMAAGGAIGVVIPPSITFVVYGSIADASITDLFKAGVIPGLLMGLGLIVAALFVGRKANLTVQPKASGKERLKAFKDAFWGLLMPVIILGGIYGSIFTPTEAAAVSVFYGLIVGVFIYREINWKKMKDILIDSCSTTATVMFITMGATLFGYVLTRARLDLAIENFMLTVTNGNTVIFFIIVNVVLLIAGCFLDSTSALYIFTPLFAPVAVQLGIDPIHLGTVMIVNLAIGLFTPPVGVNLYVACGIGDIKIEEITKGIVPCLIAELAVLLLIVYCYLHRWDYNALLSGEETALSLGINVQRLTLTNVVLTCFVCSIIVSNVGLINFIGLVAPHIVRMVVGNNYIYLIPGSVLAGAALLLLSDLVARVVIMPVILPIGALTAFLGGPLFLYLLFKGRRQT